MAGKNQADKLLASVERKVEKFLAELADDKEPNMGSFENEVRSLCDEVTALADEDARPYQEKLQSVIADLKNISETLTRRKAALEKELLSLSQSKQAQVAYKRAESYDPPANEDNIAKDKGDKV